MLRDMALSIGMWDIDFRPWGWVRLQERDGGPVVYLRYQASGPAGQERFDMQSVVMGAGGDEPLSGRTWRRIPFTDLEMFFILGEVRDVLLTEPSDLAAPSLEALDRYFEETHSYSNIRVHLPTGEYVGDGSPETPKGKMPKIERPEGRLTDDFLGDVAEAYRWFSSANQSPAPGIASQADVPVRTVHRWIYEARKRGILPPARSGRAG